MGRGGHPPEERRDSWLQPSWIRTLLLPMVALVVAVAIVIGLVLSDVVQGSRIYSRSSPGPTTQSTVLIQP